MRVTQNKHASGDKPAEPKPESTEEDEAGEGDEETTTVEQQPKLSISGALSRGNKVSHMLYMSFKHLTLLQIFAQDFPEAAVKSFHDKPHTQNDAYNLRDTTKSPNNSGFNRQVHQPRKQN